MCGSVWYTVTILTEPIITNNINYTITGLTDNTVYNFRVTASNNAGSTNATTMSVMTNSNGKLYVSICKCVLYIIVSWYNTLWFLFCI